MGIATLGLTPIGLAGLPTAAPSGEVMLSVLVLGLLCSALAFLLFFRLVAETDASRATVITYVCPLVALAVGIPILGEEGDAPRVAGPALILLGSWLGTRSPAPRDHSCQPVACVSE